MSNRQRRDGSRQETMGEEANNSARRFPTGKEAKKRRRGSNVQDTRS